MLVLVMVTMIFLIMCITANVVALKHNFILSLIIIIIINNNNNNTDTDTDANDNDNDNDYIRKLLS